MSGKPSYAAVAAKPPTGENQAGGSSQGEAPPPYIEPPQSQPHQTQLPPRAQGQQPWIPHPHPHHQHALYQQGTAYGTTTESYHPHAGTGWVPPLNASVAKARAQRRFWMAFLWAWLIWIGIGLLIGGGISDVESNPPGRHGHWDKHGDWHDDRWVKVARYLPPWSSDESAVVE